MTFMPNINIEEKSGYWLILLSRAYRTGIQELLSEHGLFSGQDLLLMTLWQQDGQTQTELAEQLQVQQSTLTRMIKRVETSGLVIRKSDKQDRRISRIFLTDSGTNLRTPVEAIWQKIENEVFGGLTLEERLLLRRLLMQLQMEIHSK
jgi:DNA-binding MarR family transcriptional regulator